MMNNPHRVTEPGHETWRVQPPEVRRRMGVELREFDGVTFFKFGEGDVNQLVNQAIEEGYGGRELRYTGSGKNNGTVVVWLRDDEE